MNALQPYVNKSLKLTNEQMLLGQTLVDFYSNPQKQVLVIDGYAGTGKTTLISAFVKYVVAKDKPVALLASTGRAAKVLSDKSAFPVETVHKHIYKLEIQEVDEIKKTKKLVFMLREGILPKDATIIVDEASMISNHAIRSGFLNFGSGRVLTDLLSYASGRKIIFVGDSCQLPPVNVPVPPVFDIGYIEKHFRKQAIRIKLTQQKRFSPDSIIFKLTDSWRRAIEENRRISLSIKDDDNSSLNIIGNSEQFTTQLAKKIKTTGIENCIGICYTNKMAFEHSQAVRRVLFPNSSTMQKGEILIVTQNNYRYDITNGEHLIIDSIGGKEVKAKLTFRSFEGRIKDYNGYRTISGLLIEELLYQPTASLSNEEEAELFVDFILRMKQKGIKQDSDAFLEHQMRDRYLNAIRAKFGYVITCHRAQGGEWDDVFVDIENSLLMNPPEFYLRWVYTAVSRSAQNIHFLKKSFIR
ncbi:MAG: hypothetical protein PWQ54_2448 [Bacteroidales bacterium]|nr:hypothetical protein [Bacteroidales bacterium]